MGLGAVAAVARGVGHPLADARTPPGRGGGVRKSWQRQLHTGRPSRCEEKLTRKNPCLHPPPGAQRITQSSTPNDVLNAVMQSMQRGDHPQVVPRIPPSHPRTEKISFSDHSASKPLPSSLSVPTFPPVVRCC